MYYTEPPLELFTKSGFCKEFYFFEV